jgi:putative SOS response-associated peptidase YedK
MPGMCYSAQIKSAYAKFLREFGATLSMREFAQLQGFRIVEAKRFNVPKAVDALFDHPASDGEREVKALIDRHRSAQATEWEQELFKQRKRLADAERSLASKPSKAAAESQRIATTKVDWLLGKLADLKRPARVDEDARFFPGWWVPVMIERDGERVVVPMRYQCRPAGKPASYDARFPGTYNARRESLGGFWSGQFGRTHGLVCINAFFENVNRDGKNVVLEFRPRPAQDMLVACLWSRWRAPGEPDLLSFAAITDEPPPEVAAAGHDRCIIPIKPEHVDAWLRPQGDLAAMQAILDDRERPYYEHRLAA